MLSSRLLHRCRVQSRAVSIVRAHDRLQWLQPAAGGAAIAISRRRWEATRGASSVTGSVEAGENKTGHINTGPNEGIFFLDNIFPLKLRWLFRLPFINADKSIAGYLQRMNSPQHSHMDPMNIVRQAAPEALPVKVDEIIPRAKEGGAYIRFAHEPQLSLEDIEGTWTRFLRENPVKPFFSPTRRVRGFMVRGRPWVEDLARFPSPRVKVEFLPTSPGGTAAELTEEQLFSLFRKYGKIGDIASQPADSKVLPRFATVTYKTTSHAIMGKNCMHGFTLPESEGGGKGGTQIKITYERIMKTHWIRDWLASHPRVVFPVIVAILATLAVTIFDPIRTFFIKVHVSKAFGLGDNKLYKWILSQLNRANDYLSFRNRKNQQDTFRAIWDDRKGDIEQIRTWMMESADTFIVIQGPRGAGKKELVVDEALKGRPHTLILDCKPIQEARGDGATIMALARQVGYRPVFPWMNNMSSLIDIAAQGTIGTKTGLSETLDAQLVKIFSNTTNALKQIALESRGKNDKDSNLTDDEWLEAHPERRPAIVVDNFLHKSNESSVFYDKMAEWAAAVTSTNVGHVIFLTHDVSFSKSLSKALPDRVFRQISLGDTSPEVAKRFVIRHLDAEAEQVDESTGEKKLTPSQRREDLKELDGCINIIGGRLTDLEFLARRIKTGESPNRAVQEIIEQSASEILKMYILDPDHSTRSWTPTQAWHLIKALGKDDAVRYNEVALSDAFKSGGDGTLQVLEQAELISIVSVNGRPHSIKPGKPVFTAAFQHLTEDRVLKARLDLATLAELNKSESANIDKYETELRLLSALPRQPPELSSRIKWLLSKVQASQAKVEKIEKDSADLTKVLQSEF